MIVHEFQGKAMLAGRGIPIPRGQVADSPEAAIQVARSLAGPAAIKAQVHCGGRGKAGGILLADTPDEAGQHAARILQMQIKGLHVHRVLVEEALEIHREFYLGMTLDRSAGHHVIMLSGLGGVDIEEVAASHPEAVLKVHVHPQMGLLDHHVRRLVHYTDLGPQQKAALGQVVRDLWRVYSDYDCSLAEINPLALLEDGRMVAADAKVNLDDNALYRHPEVEALREVSEEDPLESRAQERGLSYVRLDGDIGILGNGAGLVMCTLDTVRSEGGRAANFLDLGGGASARVVKEALQLVLADSRVRGILCNIFGGITRCDEVARGIVEGLHDLDAQVPIVIRLAGTNQEEGLRILAEHGLQTAATMAEAARLIVSSTRP